MRQESNWKEKDTSVVNSVIRFLKMLGYRIYTAEILGCAFP